MKYRSRINKPETIATPSGIVDSPVYGIEYDENGAKKVIIKGIENRYEQAQLFKEQCDVNNIVKRYTDGDLEALNRAKTFYGDFTHTPKSLMETMNMIQNARENFDKLPLNIREAYNHDVDQMIMDIGSEKFNKLFNPAEEITIEKEPVKE